MKSTQNSSETDHSSETNGFDDVRIERQEYEDDDEIVDHDD
jgi:hypothetical protein